MWDTACTKENILKKGMDVTNALRHASPWIFFNRARRDSVLCNG